MSKTKIILKKIFEQLNNANIRYCVLRSYDKLPETLEGQDIDCIAHPDDQTKIYELFIKFGFWPKKHHYHPEDVIFFSKFVNDSWITFSIAFSWLPTKFCFMPGIEEVISRRKEFKGFYIQENDDEIIHLIMNIITKGKIKKTHKNKILFNSKYIKDLKRVELTLKKYDINYNKVIEKLETDNEDDLFSLRYQILKKFGWSCYFKHRAHEFNSKTKGKFGHYLYKFVWNFYKPSRVSKRINIGLVGLDGAGKSTLLNSLNKRFTYNSIMEPTARFIYLGGKSQKRDFPRHLISNFFNKFLRWKFRFLKKYVGIILLYIQKWFRILKVKNNNTNLLVTDRTFYDTLVKRDIRPTVKPQKIYHKFMKLLFFDLSPRIDCFIMLDVPPKISLERKGEHDIKYLNRKRNIYYEYAKIHKNFEILDGTLVRDKVLENTFETIRTIYIANFNKSIK